MIGNLKLDGIVLMNLWKKLSTVACRHIAHLIQQIPNVWLHEEIIGVQFLHRIGKGVQTNEVTAIARQVFDGLANKVHGHVLGHV